MHCPNRPPFRLETALANAQAAEDAWNSRDPHRVTQAYTEDAEWRNRTEFLNGREEIRAFLARKWAKELDFQVQRPQILTDLTDLLVLPMPSVCVIGRPNGPALRSSR